MANTRMFQAKNKKSTDAGRRSLANLIQNLEKMKKLIEQIDLGEDDPDFSNKSPLEIQKILSDMENEFITRIENNKKINGAMIPPDLASFIEQNRRILQAARLEMESRGYMNDDRSPSPRLK